MLTSAHLPAPGAPFERSASATATKPAGSRKPGTMQPVDHALRGVSIQ